MRRFLSLVLLLLLLAACSGAPDQSIETPLPVPGDATSDPAGPDANGKVTISYAAWDYERPIYEALAQKFTTDHPNIQVVVVSLDDLMSSGSSTEPEHPLTMLRRLVSGADTAPAFVASADAFGSGLLLDLKPLMDADNTFQPDDFLPGALDQYTAKGGTWALPRYINVQLLTYNKELFKNAGLPEPKAGWTWSDLLANAEQLAKKNGSKVDTYGYLDASGGFLPLLSMLQEQGFDLLNTTPTKLHLDDPSILTVVKRLRTLVDSGALFRPMYMVGGNASDPGQLIKDGHIAIWGQEFAVFSEGPNTPPSDTYSFDIGKVPYPSTFSGFYSGGIDGFIVSAGTAHPNESWQWIDFLSRQSSDQNGISYNGPGRIPARQSLADQTGFWENIDAATADAYKWAIAHPAPPPDQAPDYTAISTLSNALEQILGSEQKDPQKALQEAQRQLEDQLASTLLTPTPTPDLQPVAVATPEPQEAPEGAVPITFLVNGYSAADFRRLARSFRDQHPEIFVKIMSTDTFTESTDIAKAAKLSDCFSWYAPPESDDDFNALLDLQPLFDTDNNFPESDFAPLLLTPYQRNGGLFGLPYAVTLRTLNYNRTAFDAAGIKPPTYQWKPDDFLAAAMALTKGEGDKKQFGYVPLNGVQQDLMFFVGQLGGQLTTGNGEHARPNFTDPKVIQAIKWYLDLSMTHHVMPDIKFPYKRDDPGYDDRSYEYVQNGRAGLWFDQGYGMFNSTLVSGPIKRNTTAQPLAFEVGIAPLPTGGSGLSSNDFYVRGFHIAAQTQHAQACWDWLKFLTADLNNLQGGVPARTSLLTSDAFTKQADANTLELVQAYSEALKQLGSQNRGNNPSTFYTMDTYWFYQALSEALEKKTPLDQGLANAQKFTGAFMDCLEQNPNKPATCAAQVDPSYQGYNTEDPSDDPSRPVFGVPRG